VDLGLPLSGMLWAKRRRGIENFTEERNDTEGKKLTLMHTELNDGYLQT
jgi:hypothetical protein